MRFSMSDQIQIINYFKSVDQSNFTSIKSINSRKFNFFINNLNSISRVCSSINQDARISHIASETNFTSLIKSTKTLNLEIQQKINIRASADSLKSKYLVVADVDHINKNIRVETSLTNAKKYNSIKSLIKSIEKFKSIKFNTFINCFNSTSRICFSINQDKIKSLKSFKSVKLLKSLKFVVFISSLNSIFRFSLSINHDSITSQMLISMSSRIDFLRALINQQMIYVSINSRFCRFRQRYFVSSTSFHRHLNIRVETTLKEKKR